MVLLCGTDDCHGLLEQSQIDMDERSSFVFVFYGKARFISQVK